MSKERLMRGVVCAGLALAASFALWERAALTQAPQQGDKPVEQTRKNIQVLKGLPESQLSRDELNSASLGVRAASATSTRVATQTGDRLGRESDEKRRKTAREMMILCSPSATAVRGSRGQGTATRATRQSTRSRSRRRCRHAPRPPARRRRPPPPAARRQRPDRPRTRDPSSRPSAVFDKYGAPSARTRRARGSDQAGKVMSPR